MTTLNLDQLAAQYAPKNCRRRAGRPREFDNQNIRRPAGTGRLRLSTFSLFSHRQREKTGEKDTSPSLQFAQRIAIFSGKCNQ